MRFRADGSRDETPEERAASEKSFAELLDQIGKENFPTFEDFPVVKHGPHDTQFSGFYCLASCVCWFHRFDDQPPAIGPVLRVMKPLVPPSIPAQGLTERQLRVIGGRVNLGILRIRHTARDDLFTDWNSARVRLCVVKELPVPRHRRPPTERRYVLVLGHPKRKKFLVADPHPDVPGMYKVPLDAFRVAWHAGATGKLKPWAGIVWMPGR